MVSHKLTVRSEMAAMDRRSVLKAGLGVLGGLTASGLALSLPGCGALRFDINQPIAEQKITGNILAGALGVFLPAPFALTVNLDQETKARGTGPAQSAGLVALSFQLTRLPNPPRSTDNFDFVDRIEIFVESTKSGSALAKQKVADLIPVPKGQTKIELQCYPSVDLVPYINEGARISSSASGRVPSNDMTFDGLVTIEVRV